ncbi:MAG: MFS transporter [Synergistaceae bacterium]|jgi:MFS family permease|nr:MFS transporter [Synergistaceae bacterium]
MRLLVFYLTGLTWAIYSCSNVFFMLAPYLVMRGFSSENAGILVGAFYAATTLVRPLGSWIAERAGIRRALAASACVCLFSTLLMFFAASFWLFLAIRVAMGLGFGVFVVALMTCQSLLIPGEVRGGTFAVITLGSLSCLFTVLPLADWFLSRGEAGLFLAIPVVTSALCLIFSWRFPAVSGTLRVAGKWGTWGDLYREIPVWRTILTCLFFGLCDAAIVCIPSLALSMGLIPSFFAVANGLGALVMRTMGRDFFNRHPRYLFIGPSLFVMALFLYLTTEAVNNVWLFACGFFNGMGMGYGFPALLALIGDLAPERLRAKMSSLVYFCYDVSWFVLPVYIGFATPLVGEMGAFRSLAALCLTAGVGVALMWRSGSKAILPNC